MKKFSILMGIMIFLTACMSNTPQPNPITDADKIATIVAATLSAATMQAPSTEIPATPPADGFSVNGQLRGILAFIRNNNLWISTNGIESQLTNDGDPSNTEVPKLWYSNPQISPNGTQVAYLKNTYDVSTYTQTRSLEISDINGKNAQSISNVTGIKWSSDSQKIYYPFSNGFDTTTGLETTIVKSVMLATGEIQEYGQFEVRTGCGGGSSDPADSTSSRENLSNSTGGGYVFELSSQNNYFIHATTCFGSGLGMLDLSTKQDRILDENVTKAVISPDSSKIAAVSNNNIVIFNVVSGAIENTFPTLEAPRSLLWMADGNEILYSTSTLANTLTIDDSVALDLFGSSPTSFRLNVSTLWMISLESGQSTKIIEIEAHDLKPIFANGQKVLVVMVENANRLFDYVTQGNRENLAEYYPTVNILEVDLANLISNPITSNTKQASFYQ